MAYTLIIRGVLAATILLAIAAASDAGEKTIALRDHLKTTWSNELVTYPFEAAKGQCHVESVTLSGPKGSVPCQLSDVMFWPGSETLVKTAKLSFIVDLAPFGHTDLHRPIRHETGRAIANRSGGHPRQGPGGDHHDTVRS